MPCPDCGCVLSDSDTVCPRCAAQADPAGQDGAFLRELSAYIDRLSPLVCTEFLESVLDAEKHRQGRGDEDGPNPTEPEDD